MKRNSSTKTMSGYIALAVTFLLIVNVALGTLLIKQSRNALDELMRAQMADISNTAAAMIDGDTLERVTGDDKGTPEYERILTTLGYFRDNTSLEYIYCVLPRGNNEFVFGIDADLENPADFGEPIVTTDALISAGEGNATFDPVLYHDEWGTHYSYYSPVFDSAGKVAGIVAVDFDASWYDNKIIASTWTTVGIALLSLIAGSAIAAAIIQRSRRRINKVQSQLDDLAGSLMSDYETKAVDKSTQEEDPDDPSIAGLGKKIESVQGELTEHITKIQEQAHHDGLTGVKNRDAYLETVEVINGIDPQKGGTFSIAVFDINNLKHINDTLGHDIGDDVIRDAASVLLSVFGADLVYRIGGDEFAALAPYAWDDPKKLMAAFETALATANKNERSYGAPLSLSKGYAIQRPGETFDEAFHRADTIMFEDKSAYYRKTGYQRRS